VEAIRLFSKISRGKHLEARSDIFYIQCRRVRIEQSAAPFLVDGDIVGAPQVVELEVIPGHLDVILPEPWIE
jgi:diacylglycerol kinase family enzyme